MIIDRISRLDRYLGIHPNLDTAIRYLRTAKLEDLPTGRTEIDGDQVFVNVVRTQTQTVQGREYEYHKRYVDLHLDLSGREAIAISLSEPRDLDCFDEDSDGGLCQTENPGQVFPLGQDVFAMALPWEPHLPLIPVDQPEPVHKCIFKICVE